jgi:hypothetical protein
MGVETEFKHEQLQTGESSLIHGWCPRKGMETVLNNAERVFLTVELHGAVIIKHDDRIRNGWFIDVERLLKDTRNRANFYNCGIKYF